MKRNIILIFIVLSFASAMFSQDAALSDRYSDFQAKMNDEYANIKSQEEYSVFVDNYKKGLSQLIKDTDYKKLDTGDYLTYLEIKMILEKYEGMNDIIIYGEKKYPDTLNEILLVKADLMANTGEPGKAVLIIDDIKKRDMDFIKSNLDDIFDIMSVLSSEEFYEEAYKLRDYFLLGKLTDRYQYYMSGMISSVFLSLDKIEEAKAYLEKLKGIYEDDAVKKVIDNEISQISLIGKMPPSIGLAGNINGDSSLEKHKGKVIIVDFWAPWCNPCRKAIPHLVEIYNEYREKGVTVIGITQLYGSYNDGKTARKDIAPEEETSLIKGYITDNNIVYPNGIASGRSEIDKYHVMGIPHLVFIDREFKIRHIKVGYMEKEAVVKIIEGLL